MSAQVRHPIFARLYARLSPKAEAKGVAEHRRETLAGLTGRVLELGAGNGLNFQHYPATVNEVVAVEPEEYLRQRAQDATANAPVPVTVIDAVADQLPIPDESFDAAVASLVLCSVPEQATALAELHRVLRPGGELRFYEHVRPNNPRTAAIWQWADEWNIYPRLSGGCHAARDTENAIRAAGFGVALPPLQLQGRPGDGTAHHRPGAQELTSETLARSHNPQPAFAEPSRRERRCPRVDRGARRRLRAENDPQPHSGLRHHQAPEAQLPATRRRPKRHEKADEY